MHMMVESERIRSADHQHKLERHYEALERIRADYWAATAKMQTTAPAPEMLQLTESIKQIAEQVADLADAEDEQVERAMAKLSENPNDMERALAAFQNIVGALANSPIGAALAQRLEQPGRDTDK
jgi:uncharacterized membrane protein YccC